MSPKKKIDFNLFEKMLEEGQKEEVTQKIFEALKSPSANERMYQEATNFFWGSRMYREAKNVFHVYEQLRSEELKTDVTLQEIEDEERDYLKSALLNDDAPVKVFKRMSLRERGIVSSVSVLPVKEIKISKHDLEIRHGFKVYSYSWGDVQSARITKKKKVIADHSKILRKTLHLKCKDKTFKIDVSNIYPEFKHPGLFLEALGEHISIQEEKKIYVDRDWFGWLCLLSLLIFCGWHFIFRHYLPGQ